MPSPVSATVGTTGTPSIFSNFFSSIFIPRCPASSHRFSAIMTGKSPSSSSSVRYRFLSRFVALTTFITTSASFNILEATFSALFDGSSEYVPGASIISTVLPSILIFPFEKSTVVPG